MNGALPPVNPRMLLPVEDRGRRLPGTEMAVDTGDLVNLPITCLFASPRLASLRNPYSLEEVAYGSFCRMPCHLSLGSNVVVLSIEGCRLLWLPSYNSSLDTTSTTRISRSKRAYETRRLISASHIGSNQIRSELVDILVAAGGYRLLRVV